MSQGPSCPEGAALASWTDTHTHHLRKWGHECLSVGSLAYSRGSSCLPAALFTCYLTRTSSWDSLVPVVFMRRGKGLAGQGKAGTRPAHGSNYGLRYLGTCIFQKLQLEP